MADSMKEARQIIESKQSNPSRLRSAIVAKSAASASNQGQIHEAADPDSANSNCDLDSNRY